MIATDLLAQAEHDVRTRVGLITTYAKLHVLPNICWLTDFGGDNRLNTIPANIAQRAIFKSQKILSFRDIQK